MNNTEKKFYKIVYITADWNRELVSVALNSLMNYISRYDNIHVQIFDCFGFALHSKDDFFKYEIYELPDLKNYDAVVIQAHQIMDDSALLRLEERIHEAGIPGISIGARMKGCIYIGTDDYNAISTITTHLITEHGARSFLFLKGAERDGYGEAYDRRRGFEDVCTKYGIRKEDISYFDGYWQSEHGKQAIYQLLEEGRPMPDAIVSANDEMALGAMVALKENGYSIPEDVRVTGMDDIFSASLSDPRLTTIKRDFSSIITYAMDVLMSKIRGNEVPMKIFVPFETIFSGSCGCSENMENDLLNLKKRYYAHSRHMEKYYYLQDKLTAGVIGADDPAMILAEVEKYYSIFGGGSVYLFINSAYYDHFLQPEMHPVTDSRYFSSTFVLAACGGRKLTLEPDSFHSYAHVSRQSLPTAFPLSEEVFSLFYPLHFKNTMMGFLVLTRPPKIFEMNLHESIANFLVFSLENGRQKMAARKMNARLGSLYITDYLTGLYNRFGYQRLGQEIFYEAQREGMPIRVMFLDIDDMKKVNDEYGHDVGDSVLKSLANIIDSSCRKNDLKMRYGGDEFVIITRECQADIRGRILKKLDVLNSSNVLPVQVHVSIGDFIQDTSNIDSLDVFLNHADKLMYEEKMQKKSMKQQTAADAGQ